MGGVAPKPAICLVQDGVPLPQFEPTLVSPFANLRGFVTVLLLMSELIVTTSGSEIVSSLFEWSKEQSSNRILIDAFAMKV